MLSNKIPRLVIIILLLINIALALYATPVINCGDAGSYIELSKKFIGENVSSNLAHRSPLYSIILALLIKGIGISLAFKAMIFIQYCLVFATSLFIYSLFVRIFEKPLFPIIISLLFNLSISTIYYANIILTEILTIFLLFISIHFLFKYFNNKKIKYLIILGISLGLLSLARFNAVPIIFSFLILLSYLLFVEHRNSFRKGFVSLIVFLIPYLFILNSWCLYNYYENEFYGLFPVGGTIVSRNVIVASIRPDNKVIPEYQPVLDIFIKAKVKYDNQQISSIKGSFSSRDKYRILEDLYSGYAIYSMAFQDLIKHFNLKDTDGEYQINIKMKGFYKGISKENSGFIWKLRFLSLINSFRTSTSGVLPVSYGKINLNILPSFFIKCNKVVTFFISFFVFLALPYFIFVSIKHHDKRPNFVLMVLFIIVFSFWGINFLFATAGDANRYKFPVEPLIFGLFVYYAYRFAQWFINPKLKQKASMLY